MAITVFFLLSVAYYAFFAPFLGKDLYELVAVGVYSVLVSTIKAFSLPLSLSFSPPPLFCCYFLLTILQILHVQAFSVFILYVRCTAIDPADPGILVEADNTSVHKSQYDTELPGKCSDKEWGSA